MYSYEVLTHAVGYKTGIPKKMSWDNMLAPFLIGGVSRATASLSLMPINVVRTRLQMQSYSTDEVKRKDLMRDTNQKNQIQYTGMWDAFVKIYRNEGIRGFYKGFTPSVIKIFPSSGIFFLSYEMALSFLNSNVI